MFYPWLQGESSTRTRNDAKLTTVTQGGNQTFGEGYAFTEHLKELVQKAAPKVNVEILVYPQYETRGDLGQCVMRFRNW